MSNTVAGQITPVTLSAEYNQLIFVIQQLLKGLNTVALVQVQAVDTGAETVDVLPLVNQIAGDGSSVPHRTLYGLPYFRVQGGANAVIIDPQVGDIGIAAFASRDISVVKATKAQANPGTRRTYDWADGLYFGGVLNGTPTQYVKFDATGITVLSPTKITFQAPEIDIDGTTSVKITTPSIDVEASGSATINSPAVTIEGGGTKVDGKTFLTHVHTLVQSGGSDSGPVGP